jgi:ComF family protein
MPGGRLGHVLLEFLLPPRCGGCRAAGSWLCDRCRARIRRLEEPLCRRCGAEVESARRECGCRRRLAALSRLRSAAAFEGPLERAVHRFKYEGWRPLARPLGRLILDRLVVEGLGASWVVAVPLHADRQRQRGFNQAELLAVEVRRRLAVEKPPGALVRSRATRPQVGLDRRGRLLNVRGAFEWRGGALGGRSILVIDDVATTGATLDACAEALRRGGSGPVTGFSVARVTV